MLVSKRLNKIIIPFVIANINFWFAKGEIMTAIGEI